jgi:phosphoserine aminotransferase
MPSREEVSYFGAGPAPLPTPIIEAGGRAFVNFNDTGLGLSEISHRSPTANKILAEAKEALTTLYDIPNDYEILFMQAGGTGEFSAAVYNLVGVWIERRRRKAAEELGGDEAKIVKRLTEELNDLKLDYLVTGSWSLKASQEATRLLGVKHVNIAVDARKSNDGKFGKIPDKSTWKLTPTKKEGGKGSALVYFCDNETVDGVEFPDFPKCLEAQGQDEEDERLIVADMSSNFLSRKIDVRKYAVIFVSPRFSLCHNTSILTNPPQGGAQKNVGVTGITIVIVRKSLLPPETLTPPATLLHQLPLPGLPGAIMLDYATMAKNNSLYNTLPIFNLWIASQVMRSLVATFPTEHVSGQESISAAKAAILYAALDASPDVYSVVPDKSVRSRMNICFRVRGGDEAAEKAFLAGAEKRNLTGLKGHRSVGGIRASNYNAVPMENVEKLVAYLNEYAQS